MSSARNDPEPSRVVSLSDEEAVKEVLSTTVMRLWDVVNDLTRLRPSKRERYRVAIFGSARAEPGTFVYEEVKRAAAAFAAMGCDIVTGGGPGLMQAANEGATSVGAPLGSLGIRVELPFEQDVNPFVEQAFEHKTFFTRLHHFVIASDAFVVVPGGIGTVLEMLMIWQLLQVRHVDNVEGSRRVGIHEHAGPSIASGQPRGSGDSAVPGDGRRRHRRHHGAPFEMARRSLICQPSPHPVGCSVMNVASHTRTRRSAAAADWHFYPKA